MQVKPVRIQISDNTLLEGQISFSTRPPWKVRLICPNFKELEFENQDLFECLIDLRQEIEKKNWKLLCNGSRIDVYPSRMLREMNGAGRAYILKIGEQARTEDIVHIFDYAALELIGSISEQENFHETWFRSLK
jgi:hypothetical protein